MKKIIAHLTRYAKKVALQSHWLTLFFGILWSGFAFRMSNRPLVIPSQNVVIARNQNVTQGPNSRSSASISILDIRSDKNAPFFDYYEHIEKNNRNYECLRIAKPFNETQDYTYILRPQEMDLEIDRQESAMKYVQSIFASFVYTDWLTHYNLTHDVEEPDIFKTLIPLNLSEIETFRYRELQNQMLHNYCFYFHLGKQYELQNERRKAQVDTLLTGTDDERIAFFQLEAQVQCISEKISTLQTSIQQDLAEMKRLNPALVNINKENLDLDSKNQVYKSALSTYDQLKQKANQQRRHKLLKNTF